MAVPEQKQVELFAKIKFSHPWENVDIVEAKFITHEVGPKMPSGKRLKAPYQPQSVTDFDRKKLYLVTVGDGAYYCHIGKLAESKAALESTESKRIVWPNVQDVPSEPESSSLEEEPVSGVAAVLLEKAKAAKAQQNKRDSQNHELMELQKNRHFDLRTNERPPLADKTQDSNMLEEIKELRALLEETREHVKKKEEELQRKDQELQNQKGMVKQIAAELLAEGLTEGLAAVEQSVKKSIADNVQQTIKSELKEGLAVFKTQLDSMCKYETHDTSYVLEWVKNLPELA